MRIDTEWPHSSKNEFTSCMSVKWSPRKMKWEVCVPEILIVTKEKDILVLNHLENAQRTGGVNETSSNLRDKPFLLHFFCEWMGYVLHGVQGNWSLSTDFDFDRWWHKENRDISVGVEMMRTNVEKACHMTIVEKNKTKTKQKQKPATIHQKA